MNTEIHTIEPMVQRIIADIQFQTKEEERKNQEAVKPSLATRSKTIAAIGEHLNRISENLRLLLEHSPTFLETIVSYQKSWQKFFIELRQIAASDGVFYASVGIVKSAGGNRWTAMVYRQSFARLGQDCWYPADEADYDHLIPNFQLMLIELENPDILARVILEKCLSS